MGAVKLIINSDISTDYSKDKEKLLKKFGIPYKISNDKLFFISMDEVEFSTREMAGNEFIFDMLSDIPKYTLGGNFDNFTDDVKKALLEVFEDFHLGFRLYDSYSGEGDYLNYILNNDLTIKYSFERDEEGYVDENENENEDEDEDEDEDEVADLVSTAEISSEKNTIVIDIDGNSYNGVQIGTQLWTTKNLNVSKYRNGDEIPQVQNKKEWEKLTTGAWCYYEKKEKNGTTYGRLYNWYAVNDSRGLAPAGYHIPSYEELLTLVANLGGEKVAGGKMKEEGTTHWDKPNKNATNTSCFTALPGGYRFRNGLFYSIGKSGYWWSSSKEDTDRAWNLWMANDESYVVVNYNNLFANGFSVRCLKD
jgi:uncharacterized protein (TIGR02145 family)